MVRSLYCKCTHIRRHFKKTTEVCISFTERFLSILQPIEFEKSNLEKKNCFNYFKLFFSLTHQVIFFDTQILYKSGVKDMTNNVLSASGPVGEKRPPDIGDQRKIFFLGVLSGICHGSH
jgi:hypothetical protein